MNIAMNVGDIDIDTCVKILETKPNNIMPGEFTKILYSNDFVSLNGLYIVCPLDLQQSQSTMSKSLHFSKQSTVSKKPAYPDSTPNFVYFQPSLPENAQCIRQLKLFEERLLTYYSEYAFCIKRPVCLLHNVLSNGSFKYYYDRNDTNRTMDETSESKTRYVIKISGIWETVDTFGITYKFLQLYE